MLAEDTLESILLYPPRPNSEGWVLWKPLTDERIKVKQEDYLVLHRLMTNTSEKHIWEVLAQGLDPMIVFADAPDEFHAWVKYVVKDLNTKFCDIFHGIMVDYEAIVDELPNGYTRKEFAEHIVNYPWKNLLFLLEDNRSINEKIWQMIKPVGGNTMRRIDEDAN
jgi:RNA ligase